ncbi:hypothetical protein BHE74_00003195 [Ensete ventricosum]|nr:hypothetical protein GW17_00012801 [Ensete ventricosum]RWW87952.1 hypothetical protein BHE74_00003195 [Ensete ventricosum]
MSKPSLGIAVLRRARYSLPPPSLLLCDLQEAPRNPSSFLTSYQDRDIGRPNRAWKVGSVTESNSKQTRVRRTLARRLRFRRLVPGSRPNATTYSTIMHYLCEHDKLEGCYPNSGTYQALLYGLLRAKKFVEAKDFMGIMTSEGVKPSYSSYKLIICGLCRENLLTDAVLVLEQMVHQGFVPRMGTWKMILTCML